MRRILISLILLSLNWAIGLEALIIPQKAKILSQSGSGIAANIDATLNPAALNYLKPHFGMSSLNWFSTIKGQKSVWLWSNNRTKKIISIESIGIDDIEHRIDNSDDPIGYTTAKWFALDYGSSINLNRLPIKKTNYGLGYNLKLNYCKLHTSRYWGYTFDFGFSKEILEHLNVGFIVKNIGKEFLGPNELNIDNYYGIGVAYKIPVLEHQSFFIDVNLFFDLVHYNANNIFKFAVKTEFPFINFVLGSSYSNNVYEDFSYGLSLNFSNWEVIFGSLNHTNSSLDSPKCFELIKFF